MSKRSLEEIDADISRTEDRYDGRESHEDALGDMQILRSYERERANVLESALKQLLRLHEKQYAKVFKSYMLLTTGKCRLFTKWQLIDLGIEAVEQDG